MSSKRRSNGELALVVADDKVRLIIAGHVIRPRDFVGEPSRRCH